MSLKKKILSALLLAVLAYVLFLGFFLIRSFVFSTLSIKNVTETQELVLSSKSKHVFYMEGSVKGFINGSATIHQKNSEGVIRSYQVQGDVNLNLSGDWYEPQCILEYIPENVSSGELNVQYRFKMLL